MTWATEHIKRLRAGETVSFRPVGRSMEPLIYSGQLCTVEPIGVTPPKAKDVVLCTINGSDYLHLVRGTREGRCLIGNNRGCINGWAPLDQVFGRLVKVEP